MNKNLQTEKRDLHDAAWSQLYEMVQTCYPNSIFTGVLIRGGQIFYNRILQAQLWTREEAAEDRTAPEPWDEEWVRFRRFCERIQNADMPELHFRDGHPQYSQRELPGNLNELNDWQSNTNLMEPDLRHELITA